jgi:hypothetical protein
VPFPHLGLPSEAGAALATFLLRKKHARKKNRVVTATEGCIVATFLLHDKLSEIRFFILFHPKNIHMEILLPLSTSLMQRKRF